MKKYKISEMKTGIMAFLVAICMVFGFVLENNVVSVNASVSLTGEQIVEHANSLVGKQYGANICLAFVRQVFMDLGCESSSSCCAWNYAQSYMTHGTDVEIPLGADVFFSSEGCSYNVVDTYGHNCGHIGIYVGDGYIVHAYSAKIQKMKIDTVVSHGYTYIGWGYHGGVNIINEDVCNCSESYAGAYTTTENLYLRTGHGKQFSDILLIPKGSEVWVEKSDGTWGHVTYNGNAGYSHMGYLVKKSAPVSSMNIENQSVPGDYHEYGKCFPITGKIYSTSVITYVECGAYTLDGISVTGVHSTAAPYTYEYDLAAMDNDIIFNDLEEKFYIYKAVAYDETGAKYEFGEKLFKNGNAQCPEHRYINREVNDADCINAGFITEVCEICGFKNEEYIPEKGHDWNEIYIPESCTMSGAVERKCLKCGISESTEIEPTKHNYQSSIVVPSTCEAEGYTTYVCSCGSTEKRDYTAKLSHKYVAEQIDGEIKVKCSQCSEEIEMSRKIGDINADGAVDITDLSNLSLWLIGDTKLSESQIKAADVTGDGVTNLGDLAHMRQYISKVVNWLGVKS